METPETPTPPAAGEPRPGAETEQAPPGAQLSMQQVMESLAACLEVLRGVEPHRERQLSDKTQLGKMVLQQILAGQLRLTAPPGRAPGPAPRPISDKTPAMPPNRGPRKRVKRK